MDYERTIDARGSQIGVMGDHAHVEGDIHFHGPSPPQSLHQIPDPPRHFKGRENEIDELVTATQETGVIISGMGGTGKTTLAHVVAHQLKGDYLDAQLLVDLDGTSSPLAPADAMGQIIHAFYPHADLPASQSERGGLYRSVLHGKRAVLLLDDAADADQIEPLVPPASCALIITSRTRFRIPGMHGLDLHVLDPESARALLCEIAPRIGDSVDEIAELCGFLPLALELAAGALAERVDLSPADYARRLRDKQRRLDLVESSLSLSYDLLDERLQHLWMRLAIYSIPFDRDAAAAVWEMESEEALDPLGELLRFSLIHWDDTLGRYDLHDLVRIFAYDKLEETGDFRFVHALAAAYLNAKITDEEREGTPQEALEEVDQWKQAEDWEHLARRASALVGSVDRLGYWEEIEERLQRALCAVRDHLDAPELEATLLDDLGTIAWKGAEWDRAIEMYERSLETNERLGDVHGMAKTWVNLGNVYLLKGEWDQATEYYQQSLETFERMGDVHGMATTWVNLGLVYADKGEWDRATEYYQQSLETFERMGDVHGMAKTWGNLGSAYKDKGEWDRAIEMYERSLAVAERLGDWLTYTKQYINLILYARTDRREEAPSPS